MNNLDDEAFRDNILIANNSQVRITVFMDKTLLDHSGSVYLQSVGQQFYPTNAAASSGRKPASGETAQEVLAERKQLNNDSNAKNLSDCLSAKRSYRISDPKLVKLGLGHIASSGTWSAICSGLSSIERHWRPINLQ